MLEDYSYSITNGHDFLDGGLLADSPADAAIEAVRHELDVLGNDIRDGEVEVRVWNEKGRKFSKLVLVDTVVTYECVA